MHHNEYRGMREALGYTAQEMADHHQVALKTQQRWENGHREIPQGVADEMGRLATEMHRHVHTDLPLPYGKPERWYRAVHFARTWM